jgi:dihydroorotase
MSAAMNPSKTYLIKNGRVIDPASNFDQIGDVLVSDGLVVSIAENLSVPEGTLVFDAANKIVMPGLVDLAARLREPGFEYRATLESEMEAALAGGVTSLSCPPDTDPVLDEPGLVEMLKHRARSLASANLYPLGALTVGLKGEHITEMAELAEAGCVGFSQATMPIFDTQALMRAMQYAATFGFTVWLHPQDPYLSRGGVAHGGPVASRLGLAGIPVASEKLALLTIFELMRGTGCKVHIARLSSAPGVELVRQAKAEGLPVTADVAVHHLHLIDIDIGFFDSNYRVLPPFRAQRDREGIRQGLADGTIDAICSDHTPVDDDSKQLPFADAEPGATALELFLSLSLKWALEDKLPLAQAFKPITCHAGAILGSKNAGLLKVGGVADITVFDPSAFWTVSAKKLKSQGKHTPYLGRELQGVVVATWVAGNLVYKA